MLNTIIIMGRLTRDPELRRTGSGLAVASFCVAVDRDWPNKETGEKETDFIDCVAWRQTGEFVSKYFTKGSMIVVSGRLQIRSWVDKDGNKRKTAEIVADNVYFGESKKDKPTNNDYFGESKKDKPTNKDYSAPTTPTSYGGYGSYNAYIQAEYCDDDDDGAVLPF